MKKEVFIERAIKIHGDIYNYSKVPDDFLVKDKITIVCPIHGDFIQTAHDHLSGKKCKKCKYEKLSKKLHDTTETFILKAIKIHGNKYDYSKVNYVNNCTKVCIVCPKHGEFWQTPNSHLQGRGCPVCKQEKLEQRDEKYSKIFFEKCKQKFGDKYDYSKSFYHNNLVKILIICPKHGEFWQTPKTHLNGCGCPKCSYELRSNERKYTTEQWISKAIKIHGNKYDYSKVKYVNSDTKVCIICPKHGEFWQLPSSHLCGYGCDKCAKDKLKYDNDIFIKKAKEIHGNKYDYSKVEYIGSKNKVEIICPLHGSFYVTPCAHLNGIGCPSCVSNVSKSEQEIYNFICSLIGSENVIKNDRKMLLGKELDIYIPSHKLAIEFNGLYWHSEENGKGKYYHLDKLKECNKIGIQLIQIFEDEYSLSKEIVLSKLKHILLKNNNNKIYARKTSIKEIPITEAKEFLNLNHIQGFAKSTVYLGCYYNEKLISVMSFVKTKEMEYELNRFATNIHIECIGVGGKLFSYFIKHYNPTKIKSFADLRWSNDNNNLYNKIGFLKDKTLPPDYYYVKNGKRIHKFNCRKNILNKKFGLPLTMTEGEMVKKLGYYKIWNCGLIKYIWRK